MTSETPIIERLEKLAKGIDSMLDRPDMYAQHPEALEMTILTALGGWATIIDSPLDLRTLWREEIALAFPDSKGYSTVSLTYPPEEMAGARLSNPALNRGYINDRFLVPLENRKETVKRIVYHMRRVWDQLKHTGGRREQDI
jgi:hypothetical protein